MDEGIYNRRQVITGGVLAALGTLWLPLQAGADVTPPPGTAGATLVFDVACLGNTMAPNMLEALDARNGDLRGVSFSVEGNLYPEGTIPAGDGWDPASATPTGHWFCRGYFIANPDRPLPVGLTTQEYMFSRITAAQPIPPDQIASSGLEVGVPVITRSIIGGTGVYRGVTGEIVEQTIGTNKTVFNVLGGNAPTMRFYITL